MAIITITIPDDQIMRVAMANGYLTTVSIMDKTPNPEKPENYITRIMVSRLKMGVVKVEETQAIQAAKIATVDKVDKEIVIDTVVSAIAVNPIAINPVGVIK